MKASLLFLLLLFFGCNSAPSEKAIKVQNMSIIKNIGKQIPSCNPFLKSDSKEMPTPEAIKAKFKNDKEATRLLEDALFSFKGGEPIEAYASQSIRLIIFKGAGLYLRGDGAVHKL